MDQKKVWSVAILLVILFWPGFSRTAMGEGDMTVISGFAEVNGTKLFYDMRGEGKTLVLIHGGLMDRRMWDNQFEEFAKYYRVIRYDLRGYNQSEEVKEKFSHIEDLFQLLQHLGVERTCLLGLSLGGMIAIDFTLTHPGMVEALIPVASGLNGYPYGDAENFSAKFTKIFQVAEAEGLDKATELLLQLPFFVPVDHDSAVGKKMHTMIKDNFSAWSKAGGMYIWPSPPSIERLGEIKVPTLVIVGDHDVTDIMGVAATLTNKIAGARKITVSGAGHHVNMEKPREFNRILLEFLAKLPPDKTDIKKAKGGKKP